MKRYFLVALVLASCTNQPASNAPQLDASKATEMLELAYLQYVNPDGKLGTVNCKHKVVDDENFVLCIYPSTVSETKPIHRGVWIARQTGEDFKFYAVNGKALNALEKLDMYPKEFLKEQVPNKIDIPKVLNSF